MREHDLAQRIDRLVLDPDAIHAPLLRLARPILATIGWAAKVDAKAARRLVDLARAEKTPKDALERAVEAAWAELEEDVRQVERATVVNKRPHVAHAAWLRRLLEVVARADAMVSEETSDEEGVRVVAATDPVRLLPPLSVAASKAEDDSEPTTRDARLLELQLGMVDHLIAAAMDETALLGRRQRLLQAARQILLETQAAVPLDPDGLKARQAYLAHQITRIDRLRAAGLRPDVRLEHQAREALSRGERDRLHAALIAMHGAALSAGDSAMAELVGAALQRARGGKTGFGKVARRESLRASVRETFGPEIEEAVRRAVERGRRRYKKPPIETPETIFQWEAAKTMLGKKAPEAFLTAALASGGRFEVGGPLLPVQVVEHETTTRAVRFPTQDLLLLPATDPTEIPDAVIDDPRTILLSLAAGRLLARRYVHHETIERKRTVLRAEVRVYVLDGSGSMIGARARVRDAILLAELATLRRRCMTYGGSVVLFYRYFNEQLEPVRRVATISEVDEAIADVVGTVRIGGTNIRDALLASMDQIRAAKDQDADLERAQIVLITDGEAPVDEAELVQAREQIGELPVGLSVIALGQENAALRGIVVRQRAKGEHAFYHFIDDETLDEMASGELDDLVVHLPPDRTIASPQEIEALLDEMSALGKKRDVEALEALGAQEEALREVGLTRAARTSALYKDRETLDRLFARWFPAPSDSASELPPVGTHRRENLDAVLVVLATIAEVTAVVGGSPLSRKADAIELLERLLPDARLTPVAWDETLEAHADAVRSALAALHVAVDPPTGLN